MNRVLRAVTATIVALAVLGGRSDLSARQMSDRPPVPFEDAGVCPFEGCVYRDWTATRAISVMTGRTKNARVAFRLRPGETVTALTGIVVTRRAGRVQFREPIDLGSPAGTIHVEPGRTLYLLTYLGEGFTKAWFSAEHKTAALAAWLVLANTRRKPPGGKR